MVSGVLINILMLTVRDEFIKKINKIGIFCIFVCHNKASLYDYGSVVAGYVSIAFNFFIIDINKSFSYILTTW